MRRRITEGGKPAKARRRKAATRKTRNGPKAPRRRTSSAAEHKSEIARLTSELSEALELQKSARLQQQASAEILRAVANASGDVARPLHRSPRRPRGCLRRPA